MKYNYTIDQIYLFYEKSAKNRIDNNRFQAILLSNALLYTSPSYDRRDSYKKQQMWTRFLDSLDWEKIMERNKKKSKKELIRVFNSLGIPLAKKGDDK